MSSVNPINVDSDTEDEVFLPTTSLPNPFRRDTQAPVQNDNTGLFEGEDDDLKRAMAESLKESERNAVSGSLSNGRGEADSDDDEDLRRAMAASLEDAQKGKDASAPTKPDVKVSSAGPLVVDPPPTSFISERAAMEKARLERQKRLLGESFDHTASSSEARPAKRARTDADPSYSTQKPPTSPKDAVFWDGEMRQTYNVHATDRSRPIFKIEHILGNTSDLSFAIVTAMQVDMDWMQFLLAGAPPDLPVLFATHRADGKAHVKQIRLTWIECSPKMLAQQGSGVMHIKLMLLFYKTGRLRVAVNTANLVDFDWEVIENTSWVQDFPTLATRSSPSRFRSASPSRSPSPGPGPPDPTHSKSLGDQFQTTLIRVLRNLNLEPGLLSFAVSDDKKELPFTSLDDLLTLYDFSKVKVALAASLAGKFEGWDQVQKAGLTGLMRSVLDVGGKCPSDKTLHLECQGSSIGNYSSRWLHECGMAAEGGDKIIPWLDLGTKKGGAKKQREQPWPSEDRLSIVFPSLGTVEKTTLGRDGGGTLFCGKAAWESNPQHLFRDSNSKAGPVLMHSKMIIATFKDKPKTTSSSAASGKKGMVSKGGDPNVGGWCYMGSHNFTPSAWGYLSGTSFTPIVTIKNYELGVVFPLPVKDTEKAASDVACWKRPPKAYTEGDVAWMQSIHMPGGAGH